MRCLLNTPSLRVSYDPVNAWLYNQWLGEHTAISVLACADLILECLRAQPCTKILSDHSELRGDWQAAAPLIGSRGLAQLAEQGVTCFAWIYSPFHTNRAAMERALHYKREPNKKEPAIAIFDDLAEAYEWLQRAPAHVQKQVVTVHQYFAPSATASAAFAT
ncbi:MAG: hypothetical protein ACRYG7_23275 [Janthinobacterium lividum]